MGKTLLEKLGVPLSEMTDSELEELLGDLKKAKIPKHETKVRKRPKRTKTAEMARIEELKRLIANRRIAS